MALAKFSLNFMGLTISFLTVTVCGSRSLSFSTKLPCSIHFFVRLRKSQSYDLFLCLGFFICLNVSSLHLKHFEVLVLQNFEEFKMSQLWAPVIYQLNSIKL